MEFSTNVKGGNSRRGSVFGSIARRTRNVTPVVTGILEEADQEVNAPTDITGTHTRTTRIVKAHHLTDREKKAALQAKVDAAENRKREMRRRRAIKASKVAIKFVKSRHDSDEENDVDGEDSITWASISSMAESINSSSSAYGDDAEETPTKIRKQWLHSLCDNEFMWPGVPEALKLDRTFMLEAVTSNGRALEYASAGLKWDKELVLTAVSQNGMALKHAAPELQNDRDVCLAAVAQEGESFEFASTELKSNSAFVLQAIAVDFRAWVFAKCLNQESILATKPVLKRACQEAVEKDRLMLPEVREEMEYNGGFYTSYYCALNAALADESTALVYGSYIVSLDDTKQPLKSRKDMPDEAFYWGPVWSSYDGQNGSGVLIVSLSHVLGDSDQPDPYGELLRDLAIFLRWLMSTDRCERTIVVVFMPWMSFHDRVTSSDEYNAGLRNIERWFAHPSTMTLLSRRKPKGCTRSYEESGWPVFEEAASNMAKPRDQVLDLTAAITWIRDSSIQNEFKENALFFETKRSYAKLVEACATDHSLPLSAERFGQALHGMHFFVSGDASLVLQKYRILLQDLMGNIRKLILHNTNTSEDQWEDFLHTVLLSCMGLEVLSLCKNRDLNVSIEDLVSTCPSTLISLEVADTSCKGNGLKAPWERLGLLQFVCLERSLVSGSKEELEALLPEGCEVVPGLGANSLDYRRHNNTTSHWRYFIVEILPLCGGLEWLQLDENPSLSINIVVLVENLPSTITQLSLSFTECHGSGLQAPWSNVPHLFLLNLEGSKVIGTKEELRALLPDGCQVTPGLGARQMFYNGKEFSGDEWKEFITTILPNCHGLENLYLDDNPNLKIDISVLIENCPHTIVKLSVDNCACFGDGEHAPWRKLEYLEFLSLRGNPDLTMNIVPIVKLLPASLKELYLRDTNCFGEGVKANWSHLTKLEWVHIDGSRITGTEDELEAVLPEGCYAFVDKEGGSTMRRTSLLPI